jgi:hypothetical protein
VPRAYRFKAWQGAREGAQFLLRRRHDLADEVEEVDAAHGVGVPTRDGIDVVAGAAIEVETTCFADHRNVIARQARQIESADRCGPLQCEFSDTGFKPALGTPAGIKRGRPAEIFIP